MSSIAEFNPQLTAYPSRKRMTPKVKIEDSGFYVFTFRLFPAFPSGVGHRQLIEIRQHRNVRPINLIQLIRRLAE